MSDAWKIDNSGWQDAKDAPDDPDWWYEMRQVDREGNVYESQSFWLIGTRTQFRKLPADVIAKRQSERENTQATREMQFALLPLFNTSTKCPKCGGGEFSTQYHAGSAEHGAYGLHGYIVRQCRSCKYHWHEKPLDWEDPI